MTGWHDESPITRESFVNVPDPIYWLFYVTVAVMLMMCAVLAATRVRNYERGAPDDRRTNKKNVHRRMRVQHGFDLLGMDLCPADIDHTASSADEVQSSVAVLDLIAGVDEAVAIGDRKRSCAQKAQSAPIRPHSSRR